MFPVKVETRILLNCPHCRFSSRYDTGFLEDAIHDAKEISCVACGGHFRLSVIAVDSSTTQHAVDLPIICADCSATERFEDVCKQCGSPNKFQPVPNSNLEINQTLSSKAVVVRRHK